MPGAQMGAIALGDVFGKLGGEPKMRRLTAAESQLKFSINEEADKLLDTDTLVQESIRRSSENGIVFLDEIDKITARDGRVGGDVSREGVQRDLLPLIEGAAVSTERGSVRPTASLSLRPAHSMCRNRPTRRRDSAGPPPDTAWS